MAGSKNETENIIIDDLIQSLIHRFAELLLLKFKFSRNLSMLLLQHPTATQPVDCASLCCCHQPCRRIFRNAFFRPSLKSRNQSVLSELFGNADVAGNAGNPSDKSR